MGTMLVERKACFMIDVASACSAKRVSVVLPVALPLPLATSCPKTIASYVTLHLAQTLSMCILPWTICRTQILALALKKRWHVFMDLGGISNSMFFMSPLNVFSSFLKAILQLLSMTRNQLCKQLCFLGLNHIENCEHSSVRVILKVHSRASHACGYL